MKCCLKTLVILSILGTCLPAAALGGAAKAREAAPAGAVPEAPKPANLDEAFKALATYEFGQSREALTMIADAVRDSHKAPADRARLVARLTALLKAGASLDGKRFICRQLSVAGTAESVPALAALLLDKDLSDMARYALERIPDASAADAMRSALAKATGKQKVGMINSLGERRDAASGTAIAAALRDADAMVAEAAAAALGKIGGPDAVKALQAARPSAKPEVKATIADALMLCADRLVAEKKNDEASAIYQEMYKPTEAKHVRMAALRGLVAAGGEKALPLLTEILAGTDAEMQAAALRFLRETAGPGSARTVAALLPKCTPSAQALLLDDLATRGDASTLPAAVGMLKSPDAAVRLAAIRAVGRLGDASTLPALTQLAAGASGEEQDAARAALDRLPAADVNPAMLPLAEKGDAKVRAEVLRSLAARRAPGAVPVVLKAAEDADAAVRAAALATLDAIADEKAAPAIVALITKAKDDKDRQAAEKALGSLCSRAANKDACAGPALAAIGSAEMPARCALIRVLGRAGGAKALAAVKGFIKDPAAEIQDAAIRSLAAWADAAAAPDLLNIAKTAAKPAHQVLALQGYIRLAGEPAVPANQKLKMYEEALAAAKRPDEKRQALGGLGDMKDAKALAMVMACVDQADVQAEACAAAVRISRNIVSTAKDPVRDAMTRVLEVTKDANVRKESTDLLKQAGGTPPAKAPAKKVAKAPRVSVYKAPAKKEAAPPPPPPDTSKIRRADLSAAEALGWRLGAQAYTFRAWSFAETLKVISAMGLKYVEIYPGQRLAPDRPDVRTSHDMSDADLAEMKKLASDAGVRIVNYGVVGLGKDEASARKVFEFAKKVGIETLVTETPEDLFGMLDKLTDEYKINIALHNHPKPSHYWDAETVLKGVEGHSKRIGSCADTGHWMRSGLVALDCLKKLRGRIVSLHLKDLDKMGPVEKGQPGPKDVPWGTGQGDAKAMLQELKRQGLRGVFSIEYESGSGQELVENVNKCVEWFAATAAQL
ncbi:MAG: TIM barrel protein [Planctomycetes bacterium]|nr:TIM barrel protein [Planctomycetota bacterium]